MRKLAIVGAGPAGLSAAWKLRNAPLDITIFEKSRGVCGRAASRTRHGVRLDPGANYFRIPEEGELSELILRQLPTDDLVQVEGDIWTFDAEGTLEPGDPEQGREPKWTYQSGISTLGKLIADQISADVKFQTRVGRLGRHGDGTWRILDEADESLGDFDDVLLTAPAPQLASILNAGPSAGDLAGIVEALEGAAYLSQFCFMLGYGTELAGPENCYALINTDRKHDIAWLSFERNKPGRVPLGQSVVVAQMSPAWTMQHFETPVESLHEEVTRLVQDLIRMDDHSPDWIDSQRWKFALPSRAADRQTLLSMESEGLWFAGDFLVGKGRVEGALQEGLDAGARLLDQMSR